MRSSDGVAMASSCNVVFCFRPAMACIVVFACSILLAVSAEDTYSIFWIEGGLSLETAMRKAKSKNTVYSKHQGLKRANQQTKSMM